MTVSPEEPATGVRKKLRERKARIALVIDRDSKLLGVITRGDVLIITSRKSNARAHDIMEEPRIILRENERLGSAVKRMLEYDEWYAPVVSGDGMLVGILGLEHVIQRMLDENENYLKNITVQDIMTSDVEAVKEDDYVSSLWEKMIERKYAGFPVVDPKGKLMGIVTQYDILARGGIIARETSGGPSRGSRIREIMTRSVEYAHPEDPAARPARLMVSKGYGRIPVVEEETRRLIGIVDREDIVRLMFS